jgi:hypothetical protein
MTHCNVHADAVSSYVISDDGVVGVTGVARESDANIVVGYIIASYSICYVYG